jgi:hypothetical protein
MQPSVFQEARTSPHGRRVSSSEELWPLNPRMPKVPAAIALRHLVKRES